MRLPKSFALALLLAIPACSSDKTEIGYSTVGARTFHIFREGPAAAAGVDTTIVMKSTVGGNPDSIVGWVGIESGAGSEKTSSERSRSAAAVGSPSAAAASGAASPPAAAA